MAYDDDPRLIPVDAMIKNIQKEIDHVQWEHPNADVSSLERDLQWFLKLNSEGVIYDTTF